MAGFLRLLAEMENRLYLMDTRALEDPERFQARYREMPPWRKKKIDALRAGKAKRLSLAAGILLHTALERAGAGETEPAFGENGKPYLPGGVEFNLSHSGNFAACAVSGRPVGVDLEAHRHFDERLLRHIYQESELAAVRERAAPEDEDRVFTELWTLKESFMKYLGTGILLPPREICIERGDTLRAVCAGYPDAAREAHFTRYPLEGHALAVCSPCREFTAKIEWIGE